MLPTAFTSQQRGRKRRRLARALARGLGLARVWLGSDLGPGWGLARVWPGLARVWPGSGQGLPVLAGSGCFGWVWLFWLDLAVFAIFDDFEAMFLLKIIFGIIYPLETAFPCSGFWC